jgi:hypothetical protein
MQKVKQSMENKAYLTDEKNTSMNYLMKIKKKHRNVTKSIQHVNLSVLQVRKKHYKQQKSFETRRHLVQI